MNGKLVNPTLPLNLPAIPGPRHNGGAIIIGSNDSLYLPIGDVDGQAQNVIDGEPADGIGCILRIIQDGKPLGSGIIISNKH